MNTDIRLSVGFWQHPKTRKTAKRLGLEGVRSLQILWLWAAINRPDGNLSGMDWEDIELAADWQGEEQSFFDFCMGIWIDDAPQGYVLHDWKDHNSWASEADERSDKARFSRLATVNREAYDQMKAAGINAVSKDDYDRLTTVQRPSDDRQTNAGRIVNAPPTPAPSPAPSPAPVPNPAPSPKPKPSPRKVKDIEQLELFDEFYNSYPRKTEKSAARKNWIARMNDKENPNDIIKAAIAFSQVCLKEGREQRFIKHPATFISSTNVWKDYLNMSTSFKGELTKEEIEQQERLIAKYGK